jgi:hypothetical protein
VSLGFVLVLEAICAVGAGILLFRFVETEHISMSKLHRPLGE